MSTVMRFEGLRAESRQAFGSWLDEQRVWMYRLAMKIVGDAETAEDVVQESLVRASRRAPNDPDARHGFLRKIVVREALRAVSARKREPLLAKLDPESATSEDSSDLCVRQTLARLLPEHRAILALILGEGLSYEEAALALDIPAGTVASRLSAAKASFRKFWEEQ